MSPRDTAPARTASSRPARTGSTAADAAPASAPEREAGFTPGKGRPTRSRKEAQAANRRPIVVTDRKEARRRDRQRASQDRQAAQQALMTDDESRMPLQHRGPERRFVRDVVDSRWNIAELFFPIALVVMLAGLFLPLVVPSAATTMSLAMLILLWGGIGVCAIDSFFLRRRIRSALTERFGHVGSGLPAYGIMRSLQIRRWRLPRPQIKHGDQPR